MNPKAINDCDETALDSNELNEGDKRAKAPNVI